MSVALALELLIDGDGPTETAIRQALDDLTRDGLLGEHTSGYHELIGNLAMIKMRQHWRLADTYRGIEAQAAARKARAAARKQGD